MKLLTYLITECLFFLNTSLQRLRNHFVETEGGEKLCRFTSPFLDQQRKE